MKVVVRRKAEDDLASIFQWIGTNNPRAARAMVGRIRDRIALLELDALAHMGRPGFVEGTLELVEFPYLIVYRVDDSVHEVTILAIIHGARDREEE